MNKPELDLIMESINVVIGNKDTDTFAEGLHNPKLNWDRLRDLVQYHKVTPIFYEACKRAGYSNGTVDHFKLFAATLAIKNTVYKQELLRILSLLGSHKIVTLPYKGVLFLHLLYQDKPLREMNDIDIVVQEENAVEALEVLLADGYEFSKDLGEGGRFSL